MLTIILCVAAATSMVYKETMKQKPGMRPPQFGNVVLETPRLKLRSFTENDKDEFYSIIQDPEIYKTLPEDHMYDRSEAGGIIDFFLDCYASDTQDDVRKFPLAITLKPGGGIIGNVGIGKWSFDDSQTEVFYFLHSAYWNKGYASEAVAGFLCYIKEHLFLPSLIGTVVPGNTASAKILKKNGFIRDYGTADGYQRDVYRLVFN